MPEHITTTKITHGLHILPIKRLEILSADDWEILTYEWLEIKKEKYLDLDRLGGAGDQGRDVAAYITDPKQPGYLWDCYQCKHYDHQLIPTEMWIEIGKLIYYTYIKAYPVPQKYYFVAPRGCGTKFTMLLQKPQQLKQELLTNWDDKVATKIVAKNIIALNDDLKSYIASFDFSIFDRISPKTLIEEHRQHPNHLTWFGGRMPDREVLNESVIPASIASTESEYVAQLLKAYNSSTVKNFTLIGDLPPESAHLKHFNRARISFHHAEQLRTFSRDNLPVGAFEQFQSEVHDGVINIVESEYNDGFERVKAVENQSASLHISSNALKDVSFTKDKHGVCHQLCNDKKIKWVE